MYHGTSFRSEERTIAVVIPNLVPVNGGDGNRGNFGEEGRAANVSGDSIPNDLLAPRVFHGCDGSNGEVVARRENHGPISMATWDVNATEEVFGDLAGHGFVVGREWNIWSDAGKE